MPRKEDHGNSYKQAYVERHIELLLEKFKQEGNMIELRNELQAARNNVFSLNITQLLSHLDMSLVFKYL